jgi:hypothetical protein
MSTDELYATTLTVVTSAFRALEAKAPKPKSTVYGATPVFRFEEKTPQAALMLKLARIVSGLHAIMPLSSLGLHQDAGAIARVIQEQVQDVMFLWKPIFEARLNQSNTPEWTTHHANYLKDLFQEEYDVPNNPIASSQERPNRVSRKHIESVIARMPGASINPHDGQKFFQTLFRSPSGFVHGAAPHLLDAYDGEPPRFEWEVRSGSRTHTILEAMHKLSFVYGLLSLIIGATWLNSPDVLAELQSQLARFDGGEHIPDLNTWIREAKRRGRLPD